MSISEILDVLNQIHVIAREYHTDQKRLYKGIWKPDVTIFGSINLGTNHEFISQIICHSIKLRYYNYSKVA